MKTRLNEGEAVIKRGGANRQRGWEADGGHLHLTTQRLIFESHALNVQIGTAWIDLGDITEVGKCWTKYLNRFPLFPNSIRVTGRDGQEQKFVCYGRQKWVSAIRNAKTALAGQANH